MNTITCTSHVYRHKVNTLFGHLQKYVKFFFHDTGILHVLASGRTSNALRESIAQMAEIHRGTSLPCCRGCLLLVFLHENIKKTAVSICCQGRLLQILFRENTEKTSVSNCYIGHLLQTLTIYVRSFAQASSRREYCVKSRDVPWCVRNSVKRQA